MAPPASRLPARAAGDAPQRQWAKAGRDATLSWRPFQLAFQLLALAGLAFPVRPTARSNPDRDVMDLLWFPTGGGKTEAYLGLTAFTLILRRLTREDADEGAGVAVLMRYTLRLLTVQQFERASRLVVACEFLRRANPGELGTVPFSIGLWVGSAATPNKVEGCAHGPRERSKKAQQLARCPACNKQGPEVGPRQEEPPLPRASARQSVPAARRGRPSTPSTRTSTALRPGLVIGTIDKFAQIVRKPDSTALFHSDGGPPELIIQDELHLITGPLGTVAGLYEAAIDLLCTPRRRPSEGAREHRHDPSRARPGAAALRPRRAAVSAAGARRHGLVLRGGRRGGSRAPLRGVTTAGRSPKFVLQAACASLLQGASEDDVVSPAARDWYWTLVAYFNSLRELGGALVMMQDDVLDSMKNFAALHGTAERSIDEPMELTSRVPQADIPGRLVALEKPTTRRSHPTSSPSTTRSCSRPT